MTQFSIEIRNLDETLGRRDVVVDSMARVRDDGVATDL